MKTRDEALALLTEYTKTDSLIKHSLAVEAGMRWYGKHFGLRDEEIDKWGITGLLHDFDYERYPDPTPPEGHPYKGNAILTELGYPEDVRQAIMGHALYTGTPRDTQMAKTLFAVDELSGLVTACVWVRPDKSIHTLEVSSVKKKLKDKAFARGCNRDDIKQGALELGIELDIHIGNVISSLREVAQDLGIGG